MKYLAHVLCLCLCVSTSTRVWSVGSDHLDYRAMPDWLKLPEGRTEIGAMHGDVAVSADGDVYVSVQGSVRQPFAILGPNPGLRVYGPMVATTKRPQRTARFAWLHHQLRGHWGVQRPRRKTIARGVTSVGCSRCPATRTVTSPPVHEGGGLSRRVG